MPTALKAPVLDRVLLKNYKSIAWCDVRLQNLTVLVGHNGAGKSNFLDALHFTADALRTTVEHALQNRGGINEVRRRSRGHPTHFGMRFYLNVDAQTRASYAFQIAARPNGGFAVQQEECRVYRPDQESYFVVANGELQQSSTAFLHPTIEPDRLYLTLASGLPEFRGPYDLLSRMGFYNLNPDQIRELQDPNPGELLFRDGRNLAAVVRRLSERRPELVDRLRDYLRAVVPGVSDFESKWIGPKETLKFSISVAGDQHPWGFFAANMSDGTLRVLGVLVAAFQAAGSRSASSVVGIEEPEIAVHPGAAMKLMDALFEASHQTQVIITTHSPDLLDHPGLPLSSVLAVEARANNSVIAPVRSQTLDAVRDHMYTVGELLRLDQLRPDERLFRRTVDQLRLFGNGGL